LLFHVSNNTSEIIEVFTPRVPMRNSRMEGENNFIPRICMAKTIEDCLSAIPEGGYKLEDVAGVFRVYVFDQKEIVKENILSPVDLFFSSWVLDAWVTGEHWVVEESIKPKQAFDIEIDSYDVVAAPYIRPETFKQAFDQQTNPDSILKRLESQATETVGRVTNLKYKIKEIIDSKSLK